MQPDPTSSELSAWADHRDPSVLFADSVSMLGAPALALLQGLARRTEGPIIEIGPYIGGSTIALASGAQDRVVTVELGGPNPFHPQLPTDDTIASLRLNLEKAGLRDRVEILAGSFRFEGIVQAAKRSVRTPAGLIFIDINPATELALCLYGPLLADNAFVVIDDYSSQIAVEKAAAVSAFVDKAVARGILRSYGVFGWGTWFGRLNGAASRLAELEPSIKLPRVLESGHCWQVQVGALALSDDRSQNQSTLVLFEDGVPLGPAHSLHAEIREKGAGRFSHWNGDLWFSTSDNSDPLTNGRRYSVSYGGAETLDLAAPLALPD